MAPEQARKADLWSGLFWIVLGGTIIAHSSGMPIPEHLGATVLTGPGLVPGLLGAALALLGGVLVVRSIRGNVILGSEAENTPGEGAVLRTLVALALMVVYASALALRQPFVPFTIAFITVFIVVFNWQDRAAMSRVKVAAGALALGVACAVSIEFLFETIFFVRLP